LARIFAEARSIVMVMTVVALNSCADIGRNLAVRPGKKRSTIMVRACRFSSGLVTNVARPKAITER
jgi:hypothetical protein